MLTAFRNPRDVEDIWKDHFTYYYREFDEFIFPMTIHPGKQCGHTIRIEANLLPDVSGRPHVLLMHERIIG